MEISRWIKEDRPINVSSSLEGEDWYASKVQKVGPKSFHIDPPKRKYAVLQLIRGSKIRVGVPAGQGLFLFTSAVLTESTEQNPSVELEFPQEIIRMERRAHPRLPIRLETFYAEVHEGAGGLTFTRTMALDVSGGGIRLETNRPCPPETLLRLRFHLPIGEGGEEVVVTGRVVRSIPMESAKKSQAGVEFIDIMPRQQESLIQFVMDKIGDTPPPT
jgi:c-di-GMP-binding flagellar brake protein YcgR